MSTHTPGPWIVTELDWGEPFETLGIWARATLVAAIQKECGLEEAQANARLIASAPEMYRLLGFLAGEVPELGSTLLRGFPQLETDMLAVIAKAEGR